MHHTIGSDKIMPQYPTAGAKNMAASTFPTNSMILEKTGVIWSPIPCMPLRRRQITAGTK